MSLVPGIITSVALPMLKEAASRAARILPQRAGAAVADSALARSKPSSLLALTKQTRVEPITMIDQRLVNDEEVGQVLQGLLSFFAATYLQAVALVTPVGKINARRVLDTLNPERSMGTAAKSFYQDMYSSESHHSPNDFRYALPLHGVRAASLENRPESRGRGGAKRDAKMIGVGNVDDRGFTMGAGSDAKSVNDMLSKNANLSVGRILDVTIGDGEVEKTIPVQFRLITTIIPPTVLTHILGDQTGAMTAKEVYHDWRSKGANLSAFWRDVVMADQLVKEHRNALMKDTTNTYSDILERRRGNFHSALMSKDPSLANAANLVVLSKQTASELEMRVGTKLDNFRAREKIFNNSYVMVLVVMDSAWNRVTYYHNGIKTPTTLSFNELKAANRGTGIDVEQILRAYQLGNSVPV